MMKLHVYIVTCTKYAKIVTLSLPKDSSKVYMYSSLISLNICVFCRLGLDTQSTISFENFVNHFQDNEVDVTFSTTFKLTFSYICKLLSLNKNHVARSPVKVACFINGFR